MPNTRALLAVSAKLQGITGDDDATALHWARELITEYLTTLEPRILARDLEGKVKGNPAAVAKLVLEAAAP